MSVDVHAEITQQLRRTRQRFTLGRRQLVDLLLSFERPVTIPELMEKGARQSQSSLYRNLAVLEQAGAVRRIASVDDVARYELAEELTHHHHHLVCSLCGRIDDVTFPAGIERALGEAADAANEQRGYVVDSHRFELVGTCPDCIAA
jgi:Fur family transcriptional regulator, ferric uptake regulator